MRADEQTRVRSSSPPSPRFPKALNEDGNPSFATIWALLNKHGVRIEFHAVASLADRPLVQDTSRKRSAVVRF